MRVSDVHPQWHLEVFYDGTTFKALISDPEWVADMADPSTLSTENCVRVLLKILCRPFSRIVMGTGNSRAGAGLLDSPSVFTYAREKAGAI